MCDPWNKVYDRIHKNTIPDKMFDFYSPSVLRAQGLRALVVQHTNNNVSNVSDHTMTWRGRSPRSWASVGTPSTTSSSSSPRSTSTSPTTTKGTRSQPSRSKGNENKKGTKHWKKISLRKENFHCNCLGENIYIRTSWKMIQHLNNKSTC